MGVDDVAIGVLKKLDAAKELWCGDLRLTFHRKFSAMDDNVVMYGPTTQHHRVEFAESDLCDHLNTVNPVVTEPIVIATLCDIYNRPAEYAAWVTKTARR